MALKKCLKGQRTQLKQSSITKNQLFLIKVGKQYFDSLDSNLSIVKPRQIGKTLTNMKLTRFAKLGDILKTNIHYRHGLKMFSTEGL